MRGGERVAWSRDCHVTVVMAMDRPATGRQCCVFFKVTTNYPWLTELGRLCHSIASVYCTYHGKFRTESVSGQEAVCFRT